MNNGSESTSSPEPKNPSVNVLIAEQYSLKKELETFRTSYVKLPKERRTKGIIRGKIDSIKASWNKFCLNSRAIDLYATDSERQSRYFTDNFFEVVEAYYSGFLGELTDALDKFTVISNDEVEHNTATPQSIEVHRTSHVSGEHTSISQVKLPRVEIPKFSGCYADWRSFADLFTTLIHSNESIPKVQKMYFLKTNLIGEAARLVRHLDICDGNYEPAWDLLNNRFDNKRIIVNNYLKILTSQNVIKYESSEALKKLLDTTNECLHSLRNLKIEVDKWDAIIIYLTVQRLPANTRELWERSLENSREIPGLRELLNFLESRFRTLETLKGNSDNPHNYPHKIKKETRSFHIQRSSTCLLCHKGHILRQCAEFLNMKPEARKKFVTSKPICQNCFALSHPTQGCNNPKTCYHCGQRHHTLLHGATPDTSVYTTQGENAMSNHFINKPHQEDKLRSLYLSKPYPSSQTLLATALIRATTPTGFHTLRALIDPGSQGSFITENAVQRCQLRKYKTAMNVIGVGEIPVGTCSSQVSLHFQSMHGNLLHHVQAYVLKSLTGVHPTQPISRPESWQHLHGLPLADPTFHTPGKIDILLGVNVYSQIVTEGLKKGAENAPVAQNTHLGWIIFGPMNDREERRAKNQVTSLHSFIQTDELLRRFWEIESLTEHRTFTKEERECEDFYDKTHRRFPDGRYEVRLPFVNLTRPVLGESHNAALSRLYSMERTLNKKPEVYQQYAQCLNEYLTLSHMRPVTISEPERRQDGAIGLQVNYLPHHAVFKESSTTSLRVVFDASQQTTNGVSLNDTLLTGPKLQEDLISIIMRWRRHRVVFAADICKMYRQIQVAEEDIPFQRILWRNTPSEPVRHYELTTVTFGTSCAPYLAIKTLRQLAHDECNDFPLAYPVVLNDFYVDDVMSGADTETEAIAIQEQLRTMLSRGGFHLRKWASNSTPLLQRIPENDRETKDLCTINEDDSIKALGLYWSPKDDCFTFKVSIKDKHLQLTKRSLLSQIAQLFDPIGWLVPIVILAKIMIQQLWLAGSSWDDPVPSHISLQWQKLKSELHLLESFEIPRWIGMKTDVNKIQLHGFCDASITAYCAVVYIRTVSKDDEIKVTMLAAKSKVAPVKPVTLPRLELCGAALLAKLIHRIKETFASKNWETFTWTDSIVDPR